MASHKTTRFLSSRFLLVIAVVCASFLAAFLGQIFITQLSLSPSLLPEPGIIVRSSSNDVAAMRGHIQSIQERDKASFVGLYSSQESSGYVADGWVVSNDGWIVSVSAVPQNIHFVRLDSGEFFPIQKIVNDPSSDLRYAKIEQSRLKALTIAQTADLSVLDTLISLSRSGLAATTSVWGLGAQKGADTVVSSDSVLRFPAIARSGVVGAAIYNAKEDLVGLAQASQSNVAYETMIPAEVIRTSLAELLKSGTISRPSLGVRYIDLAINPVHDVDATFGAWIPTTDAAALPVASAAFKAGLRAGDLITAVNGAPLTDRFSLSDAVQKNAIGDVLELTVMRRSEPRTISVNLVALSS